MLMRNVMRRLGPECLQTSLARLFPRTVQAYQQLLDLPPVSSLIMVDGFTIHCLPQCRCECEQSGIIFWACATHPSAPFCCRYSEKRRSALPSRCSAFPRSPRQFNWQTTRSTAWPRTSSRRCELAGALGGSAAASRRRACTCVFYCIPSTQQILLALRPRVSSGHCFSVAWIPLGPPHLAARIRAILIRLACNPCQPSTHCAQLLIAAVEPSDFDPDPDSNPGIAFGSGSGAGMESGGGAGVRHGGPQ